MNVNSKDLLLLCRDAGRCQELIDTYGAEYRSQKCIISDETISFVSLCLHLSIFKMTLI